MNTTAYANWQNVPISDKQTIFSIIAQQKFVSDVAIEKDYWVSAILCAIFSQPYSKAFVFKGGTSLSKGWNLIQRFSEDIDLAIDRGYLGFSDELNKSQRTKLRKQSKLWVENTLAKDIRVWLKDHGLSAVATVEVPIDPVSDRDPVILNVNYNSVIEGNVAAEYMLPSVKIEISCRSMREPFQDIALRSMVADAYPNEDFAEPLFSVQTVLPARTFLEKIFLLHEEFNRKGGCTRVDRLTRHMYDIEKMMDCDFAQEAIRNRELYDDIVKHREQFTAWSGLDYALHAPHTINFIPPANAMEALQEDYIKMQQGFIYGDSLSFDELIARIFKLNKEINAL